MRNFKEFSLLLILLLLSTVFNVSFSFNNLRSRSLSESKNVKYPCTSFVHVDLQFLLKNQNDLNNDPKEYYRNEMLRACYMNFVDFNTLGPRKGDSNVWISYMGDSLSRDLFYNAVQRLSGYYYSENWLNDSYRHAPLLGAHIGPLWDHAIDRNDSKTYHKSKLLCCKHREDDHIGSYFERDGRMEWKEDCLYAIARDIEGPPDIMYSEEVHTKYKSYLFRDMAGYIDTIVKPHFNNRFICLSFNWTPTLISSTTYLKTLFTHPSHIPAAIIMNIGLHDPLPYTFERDYPGLIKVTNDLVSKFDIKFLVHSPTAINQETVSLRLGNNLTNSNTEYQIQYARDVSTYLLYCIFSSLVLFHRLNCFYSF
jgi:hypothetical protein